MKCRTCQYDLWSLKPPGPCPECGTPFDPTTYTFRPNAARFLCPSCSVAYAGNGRDGLPRPRSFQCVKCGSPVVASAMAVEPAPGVDPERIMVREFPWPAEPGRSRIGAFMRTLGWSLTSPGRLGANMPQEGSAIPAMRFASYVWFLTSLFSVAAFAFIAIAFAAGGRTGGGGIAGGVAGAGLALIGSALVTVFVACPAWGGLAHLALLGGSPQGGIGRSLRCAWYATGPFIVCAVPCLGFYLAPIALIWATVSMANMLHSAHRVHALRATIAAMLLPALLLGVFVVTMALPFMGLFGAGLAGAGWSSTVQIPSSLVASLRASTSGDGLAPNHILDAPRPYTFYTWDIIQGGGTTLTLPDGSTVSDLNDLTPEQRSAIIASAGDGPLYLLADTIFCHRGMTLAGADPDLWVAFSDPRAGQSGFLIVHLANGQQGYFVEPWEELVRAQNLLRADAGLEPIPENQDELPARPAGAP